MKTTLVLAHLETLLKGIQSKVILPNAVFNRAVLHTGLNEPTNLSTEQYNSGPNGNVCGIGLLLYIDASLPVHPNESWYGYATRILPDLSKAQFDYMFKMNLNPSDSDIDDMIVRVATVRNELYTSEYHERCKL
jgi:hypothetical protein